MDSKFVGATEHQTWRQYVSYDEMFKEVSYHS